MTPRYVTRESVTDHQRAPLSLKSWRSINVITEIVVVYWTWVERTRRRQSVFLVDRIARGVLGFASMLLCFFFFLNGAVVFLSLSVFKIGLTPGKEQKVDSIVCCHEPQIRHSRSLDSIPSCVYMAGICQLNQWISQNSVLFCLWSRTFWLSLEFPKCIPSTHRCLSEPSGCFSGQVIAGQKKLKILVTTHYKHTGVPGLPAVKHGWVTECKIYLTPRITLIGVSVC